MTKKLINKSFYLVLVVLFIEYGLPIYTTDYGVHYFSCELPAHVCLIRYVTAGLIGILILALLLFILIYYSEGGFDDFFKEKTDPYLKKICDFINRRNGGCDEKM